MLRIATLLAFAICLVKANAATTFTRDVAPIVWKQCASCHRAGQPAPFPLQTFAEVKSKGRQILKVIADNSMPPWPPESGFGRFENERRLSAGEKKTIQDWVEEGATQGDLKHLPPEPAWKEGWSLGKPDIVVTMPKSFELSAEGGDLYRNFAVPIELPEDKYVRAIEFAPGNSRIVHHAFIKLDDKAICRTLDGREGVGFSGMEIPAKMPAGQFLTWQPGKVPSPASKSLAWVLPKKSDLVLQLHLNRTGKPETLQSSVGIYFTDQKPTGHAAKFLLGSFKLHFLPGTSNNVITDSYTLPVDVRATAILPHAHYLARQIEAYAELPNGSKEWLIKIKDWDFRWQGDYRYVQPLRLPAGTKLHLRMTYDNSTNNPRNPNNPPKVVDYGPQSSDEMCELWLQFLTSSEADLATLAAQAEDHQRQMLIQYFQARLEWYPNDPLALTKLASLWMGQGKTAQALANLKAAIQKDPDFADAHFNLGVLYRMTRRPTEAKRELETSLQLDPKNPKAWGHLGFLYAQLGDARECERCFRKALELDPADKIVQQSLQELLEKTR